MAYETDADSLVMHRLSTVEEAVKSIAENFRMLVVLEQKHVETREALARAFEQIDHHDERIRTIESEMPLLRMVRGWVVAGVIGIVSLVGIALVSLVVISRIPEPYASPAATAAAPSPK